MSTTQSQLPCHVVCVCLCLCLFFFSPGFNVLEAPNVPSGEYIITATTYGENQEGPFFITASSDNVFNFESLQS